MSSNKIEQENVALAVKRTPAEIQLRIEKLEKNYWHLNKLAQLSPDYFAKSDLTFRAIEELRWILGEDVDANKDLYV